MPVRKMVAGVRVARSSRVILRSYQVLTFRSRRRRSIAGVMSASKVSATRCPPREPFGIVSGRAKIRVGRRLLRARAGESVVVPRRTVHRLWNDGVDELHVLVEFRPALRTEEGFEQLFGLARDGKLSRRGFPHPLQLAVMAKAFRNEGRFPFVPVIVQRALIAPFAVLGTWLGYRAVDPRLGARGATP